MQHRHSVWVAMASILAGCGATVDGSRADPEDAARRDASSAPPTLDATTGVTPDVATEAGVTDRPLRSDLSPRLDAPVAAPPAVPHVVDVVGNGEGYQCALMHDGTVRCRGTFFSDRIRYDDRGRIRPGEVVEMEGLDDVAQLVGHYEMAVFARRHDGSVWSWGRHTHNLLGVGRAGADACDGEPCRRRPTRVDGLDDVVWLTSGDFTVCAVRGDGSVWCWGSGNPLLGTTASITPRRVEGLANVTRLWKRWLGWVARLRDGSYAWANTVQYAAIPRDATVAHGPPSGHLCYRLPDATLRCLGFGGNGVLGNGVVGRVDQARADDPGLTGVRQVVTGPFHNCAVRDDDTVWCWGSAEGGGLGFEGPESCEGHAGPVPCATRPRQVPGLDNVDRVMLVPRGACALRRDRSLWCWGSLGDPRHSLVPAPVAW